MNNFFKKIWSKFIALEKQLFYKASYHSRRYKIQFYEKEMNPLPGEVVIDLGCGFGDQLSYLISKRLSVIAIDKELRPLKVTTKRFPDVMPIFADGLRLPLKKEQIDLGFSNAVLEHLPASEQRDFIEEFRRAVKRGIIYTPSKFSIIEPHFMVPFFQFLPKMIQKSICSLLPLGIFPRGRWEEINLISLGKARRLSPGAECILLNSFLPAGQIAIIFY